MIGTVFTAGVSQWEAHLVKVEVDVANGLPGWNMVGLPEKMVQESKDRVAAALRNSGISLEARKTTINLAPADCKKRGNHFDLPIAIGLLRAHQAINHPSLKRMMFVGELSLTGELKPIHGTLLFTDLAKQKGFQAIVIPTANRAEAALISDINIIACRNIGEVLAFLHQGILPQQDSLPKQPELPKPAGNFSEIAGQYLGKRGLEIAAAGKHHLLMMGPPGSGKTMLASRFSTILPKLNTDLSIETTKIHSLFGKLSSTEPLMNHPPFRSPHHSITLPAMVGGGDTFLQAGEITLAHNGVLFLDELPEFKRDTLEALREPLEMKKIHLRRTKSQGIFPADFQLIAAMNPCRCGYLGHPKKNCVCDPATVLSYRQKISGPLLDRIDLHVEVSPLSETELFDKTQGESSETIFERVWEARKRQAFRYRTLNHTRLNGELSGKQIEHFCLLTEKATFFFRQAFRRFYFSARSYERLLKIARTIADLSGVEKVEEVHMAEALQFRGLDEDCAQ